MTIKVAINGLGRIGRCLIRAAAEYNQWDIEIVAANGPAATPAHLHLLKYDSVHGRFPGEITAESEEIRFGKHKMKIFHEREPEKLPWKDLGVDVVLECSGKFTKKADAERHIAAGAKKVLISAPSPDAESTIVYGVNNAALKKEHKIVSVGSCTTNCLAPVAKTLNDAVGIVQGYMTTIHAYTSDQNIHDGSHKDLRRARAATLSMVPTSTGAAKALGLVLPELKGKLDGTSIRVPTPNVSLVDLTFNAGKATSAEEINNAIKAAASGPMKGVLGTTDEPLVSIDFNHSPFSSVFDLTQTAVVGGSLVRVAAWYDNEWGFSCRMWDVTTLLN
ncbi:MAG: type I glyceraldehyde-3-phosphate dehydrogenase [Alphaproteobacteria bacterium]|nr:type I glyceraldehyde-3-phosphate dehydrogenase [Alphaproteobacteria bacterium]